MVGLVFGLSVVCLIMCVAECFDFVFVIFMFSFLFGCLILVFVCGCSDLFPYVCVLICDFMFVFCVVLPLLRQGGVNHQFTCLQVYIIILN